MHFVVRLNKNEQTLHHSQISHNQESVSTLMSYTLHDTVTYTCWAESDKLSLKCPETATIKKINTSDLGNNTTLTGAPQSPQTDRKKKHSFHFSSIKQFCWIHQVSQEIFSDLNDSEKQIYLISSKWTSSLSSLFESFRSLWVCCCWNYIRSCLCEVMSRDVRKKIDLQVVLIYYLENTWIKYILNV